MDEVYRRMKWLDIHQAVDWIQRLTGKPLTAVDLLRLCDSKQCDVYIDTLGLLGVDINSKSCEPVMGVGFQKVLTPLLLKCVGQEIEPELYYERAPFTTTVRGVRTEYPLTIWAAKTCLKDIEALFKPDDILALAVSLKPDHGFQSSPNELEDLRRELGMERARRQAAEAEIAALRQRIEDANARQQFNEASEIRESSGDCSTVRTKHHHDVTTAGLVFPYATKRLEAMRAVAVKHWASYTADKRRPTQKEIGLDLSEALGLPRQANNEPAREAKVLAVAIKPDNQPDA